jgi:hypothetical protein
MAITQADFFIDAKTGNDTNNGGSPATALRSHEELAKRIKASGNLLTSPVHSTLGYKITTVNILTDLPEGDPINLDGVVLGQDVFLLYKGGAASTVRSGTFTNVVAKDPATNQPFEVEDSAMSGTWTADLGRRVRITSGTRENAIMWVAKDLGSNRARVSDPSILGPSANYPFETELSPQAPQAGDAYAVETLPQVTPGLIHLKSQGLTSAFRSIPSIIFRELDFADKSGFNLMYPSFDGVTPYFSLCRVMALCEGFDWETALFLNCFVNRGLLASGLSQTYLQGGLIGVSEVRANKDSFLAGVQCHGGGWIMLQDDVMLQDVGVRGQNLIIQAASIFDSVAKVTNPGGHGVFAGGSVVGYVGGTVSFTRFSSGMFRLWGSGNTGAGVAVGPGAQFAYEAGTFPTISGTAGDFTLGGATSSRAWDNSAGAYTTDRSNTWANLAATIAAGGLGGNAHNLAGDAHIVGGL